MRNRPLVDIAVLGLVFWGVWSLRFAGVQNIGLWSVVAGVGTAAALAALRKEPWREFGLRSEGDARFVLTRAGEFMVLTLAAGAAVIGLATAIGYPPSQSAVLTQQPDTVFGFLFDILFGVWIGAAIGEEILFRGFLLKRFSELFGSSRSAFALAVLAQGVWFGCGHASQGISGMIMASVIGVVVGTFFLTRARGSLVPLILGHGIFDTVSQTIYFVSR
jgi:membrane protease YdiL (CAAX protease family)